MKIFCVVDHNAHEFAHRLITDMSVFAAAQYLRARYVNVSWTEGNRYLIWVHRLIAISIDHMTRRTCAYSTSNNIKELPPTAVLPPVYEHRPIVYFFGWLFRNPLGLDQYRFAILKRFAPKRQTRNMIKTIADFQKNTHCVGLFLKNAPFKGFPNGDYLITPQRAVHVLSEYLKERELMPKEVTLLVVSDTPVSEVYFSEFHTYRVVDVGERGLWALAACDSILGFNALFADLAAWLGDIPFIVLRDENIDWPYYRGKTHYFSNKYATFTHGNLNP